MKTVMAMVNKYGEILCELELDDGGFFYRFPANGGYLLNALLCEGDEFRVEKVEVED